MITGNTWHNQFDGRLPCNGIGLKIPCMFVQDRLGCEAVAKLAVHAVICIAASDQWHLFPLTFLLVQSGGWPKGTPYLLIPLHKLTHKYECATHDMS